MQMIKEKTYEQMGARAAAIIAEVIHKKENPVLGLATGSTPISTYQSLIQLYENGSLDFSKVTSVNLDEYKGLSGDNDQSYRYFMNHNLFDHVNIDKTKTFVPNGLEADSAKACSDYDKIINEVGQIDIQVLGLGLNGHIGFNEPADHFPKTTHCVDLTQSTIDANSRFFETMDEVPKQAYTMGIQTIMSAKTILVLVNGSAKADIVKEAFFGPITPQVPASILQLHDNVILVGDEEALSKIEE